MEAKEMGARLVTLVLMRWTDVGDVEFRLLVRMAHTALDEATAGVPAGMYFAGHGLLISTLRSEGGSVETLTRRARKALKRLVELGAIERVGDARSGVNAVYRLTLHKARKIDNDQSTVEGQAVPTDPAEAVPQGPAEEGPTGPASRFPGDLPRNHEEPVEELYEERNHDLDLNLAEARASPCEAHPSMQGGDRADGLPACPFCRHQARAPTRPTLTLIEGGAA